MIYEIWDGDLFLYSVDTEYEADEQEKQALLLKLGKPHEGFKMEFQRRYDEEGRVAVLISPGFGAGWSSWGDTDQRDAMLFDSRLVDFVLAQGTAGLADYAESLGYTGYMGGASDVQVEWLESGTRFMIDEYDGSESIRTFDDLCHVA